MVTRSFEPERGVRRLSNLALQFPFECETNVSTKQREKKRMLLKVVVSGTGNPVVVKIEETETEM